MTNGELAQSTGSVNEFKDTFYSIDPAWYENHGISLSLIVHQRRCAECQAYEAWNESPKKGREKFHRKLAKRDAGNNEIMLQKRGLYSF